MDLSVITVTYQSEEYIDSCILSVVTSAIGLSYEHIIVDNCSTDGTVELIENHFSSYVTVIKNGKNVGFAAANNQAVALAKGRYFLFLNPDMQIIEGTLDSLIEEMDRQKQVGMSCCKLIHPVTREPHPVLRPIHFPKPAALVPFFFNLKSFVEILLSRFAYTPFDDHQLREIEHGRGSFLLVRREIVDTLGFAFDPAYFILIEDVDLCREVHRLGYKVLYNPAVSCIDYFGASFSKQPKAWTYVHLCQSLKTYVCKWHSPLHLLWLNPVMYLGLLLRKINRGLILGRIIYADLLRSQHCDPAPPHPQAFLCSPKIRGKRCKFLPK